MVADGLLSAGHARTLIALKSQRAIADCAAVVVKNHLSVRDTEKLVKRMLEQGTKESRKKPARKKSSDMETAEKALSEVLETKVSIEGDEEKGRVVLAYYSKEQLNSLYEFLMGK